MYVLLTGGKKNIGDYLIGDRTKKLLGHERPDREIVEMYPWGPLGDKIDRINESKAVIIHGGPGYQRNMYPGIYPLVENLSDIKVPIIPMALGWKGIPGDDLTLRDYRFNDTSLELLRKIHAACEYSSCRDYLTQRVLLRHGFTNVLMTGCSVWYDVASIGKEFVPPRQVRKIAFTPPQLETYREQFIDILKELRTSLPDTELVACFHRGVNVDEEPYRKDNENIKTIMKSCKDIGVSIEDVSYDLSRLSIYDDCDVHIGYRLHGHLLFLSKRKPSILINEDGRGRGAQEALGLQSINGFERNPLDRVAEYRLRRIPKLVGALNRVVPKTVANRHTVGNVTAYLREEMDNGFERVGGVFDVIDKHYTVMQKFLKSLP